MERKIINIRTFRYVTGLSDLEWLTSFAIARLLFGKLINLNNLLISHRKDVDRGRQHRKYFQL